MFLLSSARSPLSAEVPRDAKVAAISEKKRAWRAAERNKGDPRKRWSGEQRKRQAEPKWSRRRFCENAPKELSGQTGLLKEGGAS